MKLPRIHRGNLVQYFGGAVAVIAFLIIGFTGLDSWGLKPKAGEARVTGKQYRPLSHGTYTTKVGSSYQTHTRIIPEAWLVTVDLNGTPATGPTTKAEYDAFKPGDSVMAVYAQKRITRSLVLQAVMKPEE
jgi:hypothetical protein